MGGGQEWKSLLLQLDFHPFFVILFFVKEFWFDFCNFCLHWVEWSGFRVAFSCFIGGFFFVVVFVIAVNFDWLTVFFCDICNYFLNHYHLILSFSLHYSVFSTLCGAPTECLQAILRQLIAFMPFTEYHPIQYTRNHANAVSIYWESKSVMYMNQ